MPIKGLTDRGLSFPLIGKIRKGAPKTDNAPGKDLTYFRIETDLDTEKKLRHPYGEQPRSLNVALAFPEIDRVWSAYEEAYTAGRMIARSDGECMLYWVTPGTGEVKVLNGEPETPRPQDGIVGYYISKRNEKMPIKLKPVGRLSVVIPELKRLAYFLVLTTSTYDILNISQQLRAVEEIARRTGRTIAGIPLILNRRPAMISVPSGANGERVRREKWLLNIEVHPAFVEGLLGLPQLGSTLEVMELPAGVQPVEDEDEDVLDGEIVDEPPQPPPPPAPAHTSNKQTRPLAPDKLKESLLAAAEKSEPASAKEIATVAACLEYVFLSKDKRYMFLKYLFGKERLKDLDPKISAALHRWLKPVYNPNAGVYEPGDEYAAAEANAALEVGLKTEGQQTLPLN